MIDSSRKKQKITYIATPAGVEQAERALQRLGCESKIDFAKSQYLARNTVTKFFQRQPIQLDSFKRICEGLMRLDLKRRGAIFEDSPGDRAGVLVNR
ncbi:MAG: hypothetical protein VKL59_21995 [Nostocaceae cyanobacterium]|nr:hypothetical protein [Nostocaceae cyanobacterium]